MRHRTQSVLILASLASFLALPEALPQSVAASTAAIPRLTLAEETALAELIAQHRRVQSRFPAEDRSLLDRLTVLVKPRLFGAPLRADLLGSAAQIVGQIIPELTLVEAGSLGEYSLAGIASDTSLAPTLVGVQAAFNQQLLQVQMSMQRENQVFTSVSNVLKTRHDTVKNSIGNIR